jgi:hypothetical protein
VGLTVNADKTAMVLFTNNRKLEGFKKPILFATELQLKNQVKYLGVEKLNWNSHIDHRMQKATICYVAVLTWVRRLSAVNLENKEIEIEYDD